MPCHHYLHADGRLDRRMPHERDMHHPSLVCTRICASSCSTSSTVAIASTTSTITLGSTYVDLIKVQGVTFLCSQY